MTQESTTQPIPSQAGDQGNNLTTPQPPDSMSELRIVPMPEGRARYIPEELPDPGALVLVTYGPFMEVVRELASGQMNGLRSIGAKLEAAVVQNGTDVVASMSQTSMRAAITAARAEGMAEGRDEGLSDGTSVGYRNGYQDGHKDGVIVGHETITVGALAPAQVPIQPPVIGTPLPPPPPPPPPPPTPTKSQGSGSPRVSRTPMSAPTNLGSGPDNGFEEE